MTFDKINELININPSLKEEITELQTWYYYSAERKLSHEASYYKSMINFVIQEVAKEFLKHKLDKKEIEVIESFVENFICA